MTAPGIIVDSFAGGGGASLGIRQALGRGPDVAINHDRDSIAVHAANHPEAVHYSSNIWQVDPDDVVRRHGRVALAWFSPDCKHFSKAKGSRPAKRNIRDLAWVVVLWARRARPRVILLENVEEFRLWGPIDLEGRPCPDRAGETFRRWVGEIKRLGYKVEWKELRACHYGAPTIRKRLFLVARCDGLPIRWPEPTHGPGLEPYRTAADCIDWSLRCPSIFLSKEQARELGCKRPLSESTLRRIARGTIRYVVEAADPFLVPITHVGDDRVHPIGEPLRTVTTAHRGEIALVAPLLTQFRGDRAGRSVSEPAPTVTANSFVVRPSGAPSMGLVAAHLINMKGGDRRDAPASGPAPTVCAGGQHVGVVAAFLAKYYGTAVGQDPRDPLHTVPTHGRFGVVTVHVAGQDFVIADIGMRMLAPRELYRAQGFPDSYITDRGADRRPITKTAQIRLCGNSVCPPVAEALVRANCADLMAERATSEAAA